jgi:hypothetical protein
LNREIKAAVDSQTEFRAAYKIVQSSRFPHAAKARLASGLTPERVRALLELEAAQPKEWDAESIKEAPEGEYLVSLFGQWLIGILPLKNVRGLLETDGGYEAAYGPIPSPQPPAPAGRDET